MRVRWLGFLLLVALGLLSGAGTKLFLTINPFTPIGNTSSATTAATDNQVPTEATPPVETPPVEQPTASSSAISPVDSSQGELIVEGLVDSVSVRNHSLRFTQEMDDQSKKVNPRVVVLRDAVIELNNQPAEFDQLMVGDYVTMILTKKYQARAIQIER